MKRSHEFGDKVPAHLLQSLRTANITDTDPKNIRTKLQERTSSQIISYLQLGLLKLQQTSVAAREFSTRMRAQKERTSFGAVLEEQLKAMRDS
jgi:hypothetical protein